MSHSVNGGRFDATDTFSKRKFFYDNKAIILLKDYGVFADSKNQFFIPQYNKVSA